MTMCSCVSWYNIRLEWARRWLSLQGDDIYGKPDGKPPGGRPRQAGGGGGGDIKSPSHRPRYLMMHEQASV